MELIAQQVLGSATASVTFSSIPGTFRDLVLICSVTPVASYDPMLLRFNNDTGGNYSFVRMLGTGSATNSTTGSNTTSASIGANETVVTNTIVQVMDYSTTNKHKTLLSRGNQSNQIVEAYANRWANTAAVTSINVRGQNLNLPAGSTFTLYGIVG